MIGAQRYPTGRPTRSTNPLLLDFTSGRTARVAASIPGFCRERLAAYKRVRRVEFTD
jgi:hypothetical protein